MKRYIFIPALAGLCVFFAPAWIHGQSQSVIGGPASSLLNNNAASNVAAYLSDEPNVSDKMQDLIKASDARYLEGSNLIKSGESARARVEFDAAVDLLLQSEWDISSTPPLNRYFQDLIQRIQRDESRYLRPDDTEISKEEPAVLDELEKVDLIPIQVDLSLRDTVEADILTSKFDIPVIVNESVYKSMKFWLDKGRKFFVAGLTRSGKYQEMIGQIFREESLPLDLMYLAQVESLFSPNALSRAAAKGIWQFTRGTAIRYGLRVDRYIDERSDPEKSTRAAARYLNDLYAMFHDWNLVLAAYNWGEGAIQKLVDKSGLSDFWDLANLKRKMPQETKNHIPLIMASIILAHNPEKYGLPVELDPPLAFDKVKIDKRINLRAAAKALDVPADVLTRLNPALRTIYTPPNYPDFVLNVPAGMGEGFTERLASLPAVELKADPLFNGRYKVSPGDTLSGIAARFRVSVDALQMANNLESPKSLRAGAYLVVPSARTTGTSTPARPVQLVNGTYKVQEGETLSSIARRFNVTVEELQKANNLQSPESLRVGTVLKVRTQAASVSAPKDAGARRHQVKSGETLSSIASRYQVPLDALQKANGIRSPQSLQVGAWLQIPSPTPAHAPITK